VALEQPGADLALPGLHIAEVVADQAARNGHARVGLLGTKYTLDGPVYPRALAARGIATEVPVMQDRVILHEIILADLVNGVFTERARREYARIIGRLAARGCDAVGLVCTEIPLLVPPEAPPAGAGLNPAAGPRRLRRRYRPSGHAGLARRPFVS